MMQVPALLFELLGAMMALSGPPAHVIDLVEYFCGVAAITQNFRLAGYSAIGYDVDKDSLNNNLCMPQGFLCALRHLQALRFLGLAWFATVCSSWVGMSRRTTGREHDAMGFHTYMNIGEGVQESTLPTLSAWQGNMQVARSALLMCFTAAIGATWILEQPSTSIMIEHKCMQHLYKLRERLPWLGWHHCDSYMVAFGTKTLKASFL